MSLPKVVFLTDTPEKFADLLAHFPNDAYAWAQVVLHDETDRFEADVREAAIVVEWVSHARKAAILQQLDFMLPETVLIMAASHASLTTQLAAAFKSPERLVGYSPMALTTSRKTLTLSQTPLLSEASRQQSEQFWQALGYATHWIQDTPALVLPRIYAMLANEAAFALQEGVASVEDIDTAMRLGTNYPIGPLAWADLVGVDAVVNILTTLWETYHEARYRPCLLLQKMVASGQLGRTTGQGFYTYAQSETQGKAQAQKVQVS